MRIRTLAAKSLMLTALGASCAAVGCAGSGDAQPQTKSTTAHLLALSTYSASLGSPIDAFIENPPDATARSIELLFDGTFVRSSGKEQRVSIAQATTRTAVGTGAVRWTTFGPFANPFTPTDPDTGTFRGRVAVRVTNADGTTTTDENPLPIEFEVKPSIIVTELQPTTAECDKPALALIGLMSYKMKATTIGFNAKTIEYSFKTPGVVLDSEGAPTFDVAADNSLQYKTTTVSHEISQPIDKLDGTEALVLPPVPADQPSYPVIFSLTARDEQGRTIHNTFGMTAHNPLEVVYDGRYALAQIYEPKAVSSCIPGGQQGRSVTYDESVADSRQRQVTLTLSRSITKSDENSWSTTDGSSLSSSKTTSDSFSTTHGTTNSFSYEENGSHTNSKSVNWYDSKSHGWNGSVDLGVDIKVFHIGGSGGGDVSWTRSDGGSRDESDTKGWSKGTSNTISDSTTTDHSTSTTDTSELNHSDTKGGSNSVSTGADQGTSDSWTVSSTTTIQKSFSGQVIANTYGVFYRQMARYTRQAFVLEYNKCGETDVVGNLVFQDYTWAPDLALSEGCPPLPKTNFPPAQCFLPPCEN